MTTAYWHSTGCLTDTYECQLCRREACPDCAPSPGEPRLCADCWEPAA